jgi:predicted metal-dependent phosphotriesterase family hydrolase
MTELVVTVAGPIPADQVGFTLPHEHLSCSLDRVHQRQQLWDFGSDVSVMAAELAEFRGLGGDCVVDLTPPGLGRDPRWQSALAARTGLHIVMSAGWYRESFYPPQARIGQRSVDDLADELVGEINDGVEGTGIRPGILGEIGTDQAWVSPAEERVHRAVGRAAVRAGLAVVTHSLRSTVGLTQLRIFEEEGLEPERVVIGHADSVLDLDHHLAIVGRGANLCMDLLGLPEGGGAAREDETIKLMGALVERGYSDRILLSQDVCSNAQLKVYGGGGYAYVAPHFLPRLRSADFAEADIAQFTIHNPRRLLTVARSVARPPSAAAGDGADRRSPKI